MWLIINHEIVSNTVLNGDRYIRVHGLSLKGYVEVSWASQFSVCPIIHWKSFILFRGSDSRVGRTRNEGVLKDRIWTIMPIIILATVQDGRLKGKGDFCSIRNRFIQGELP